MRRLRSTAAGHTHRWRSWSSLSPVSETRVACPIHPRVRFVHGAAIIRLPCLWYHRKRPGSGATVDRRPSEILLQVLVPPGDVRLHRLLGVGRMAPPYRFDDALGHFFVRRRDRVPAANLLGYQEPQAQMKVEDSRDGIDDERIVRRRRQNLVETAIERDIAVDIIVLGGSQ